jgi:hypothetical protein
MRASVIGMNNQFSIRASSLCFAPTGNLRYDLINVIAGVKAAAFREQLDDMKPSNRPNYGQHEFRGLNHVTLSIRRSSSGSKPYSFMVSVEIEP